jgi:hypothetical protein
MFLCWMRPSYRWQVGAATIATADGWHDATFAGGSGAASNLATIATIGTWVNKKAPDQSDPGLTLFAVRVLLPYSPAKR